MTQLPTLTPYGGAVPNKETMDREEFANAVHPYLNYFNRIFVPQMQSWSEKMNTLAGEVSEAAQTAQQASQTAEQGAQIAAAAANFAGEWDESKSYAHPVSVIYDGTFYISLRDSTGKDPEVEIDCWVPLSGNEETLHIVGSGLPNEAYTKAQTDVFLGAAFRNHIINGDFSIWQRGEAASYEESDTGVKAADRMGSANEAGGLFDMVRSKIGDKDSVKFLVFDAQTDFGGTKAWGGLMYKFDPKDNRALLRSDAVTVSFVFKSNVAGKFAVSFGVEIDDDGNSSSRYYATSFTVATADTPQRVAITIPIPSDLPVDTTHPYTLVIAPINYGDFVTDSENSWNTKSGTGHFQLVDNVVNWAADSNNYIEIAELQFEAGNIATPFEHVPYDIQLIRCLRYWHKAVNPTRSTVRYVKDDNSFAAQWEYAYPVKMRIPPTANIVDNGDHKECAGGDCDIITAYGCRLSAMSTQADANAQWYNQIIVFDAEVV